MSTIELQGESQQHQMSILPAPTSMQVDIPPPPPGPPPPLQPQPQPSALLPQGVPSHPPQPFSVDSNEPIPPDPCNLIVNYIPTPVTDAELQSLFAPFGPLVSARVIVNRETKHPKGYGFVKFQRQHDAEQAMTQMNGYEIYGKRLKVTPARGYQSQDIDKYLQSRMKSQVPSVPPPSYGNGAHPAIPPQPAVQPPNQPVFVQSSGQVPPSSNQVQLLHLVPANPPPTQNFQLPTQLSPFAQIPTPSAPATIVRIISAPNGQQYSVIQADTSNPPSSQYITTDGASANSLHLSPFASTSM